MSFVKGHATVKTNTIDNAAAAYAAGDVVGTPRQIKNFSLDANGCALLNDVLINDIDDQKASLDLYFFDTVVTPGADNAPFSLSDAESLTIVGKISILNTDYVSVGTGQAQALLRGLSLLMRTAVRHKDLWMVVVNRGSPTYATVNALQTKLSLVGP